MVTYKVKQKGIVFSLNIPVKHNGKTILLLEGLPASANNRNFILTLVESGFVVFQPDYSGSGNSNGFFSIENCIKDVPIFCKIIKNKNFQELYFMKDLTIETKEIIIISSSFGSTPSILSGCNDVSKLVLISPVFLYNQNDIDKIDVNFNFKNIMLSLIRLITHAYSFSYRINDKKIFKLDLLGHSFITSSENIIMSLRNIKIPTLVFQKKEDTTLSVKVSEYVIGKTGNSMICFKLFPGRGHSLNEYTPDELKILIDFIK